MRPDYREASFMNIPIKQIKKWLPLINCPLQYQGRSTLSNISDNIYMLLQDSRFNCHVMQIVLGILGMQQVLDSVSANLVWDVHRPVGVMISVKRLAGAGCKKLKIEPSSVKLERSRSSSGLR